MATEAVVGTLSKALEDENKADEEPILQLKDFVWDQFLKYISSAILALTVLNLSVEFLRGGGVLCFPPILAKDIIGAEDVERDLSFSVRHIDFFNGYCARSIPHSEFFPLYILVHGILLIAPHYIWSAVFKGDFDSFFAVTRKLDRLRDRNTGDYNPTNFDRVEKLEIEFGGKRRKIFYLYIAKLFLQLLVCIGSFLFSGTFFRNFASVFQCPNDLSKADKWPLNTTISCIYSSLRILSLVRYADYILLILAIFLIIFALIWCTVRHTKELGHKNIANFVFQSCLSTKTYVFPPFYQVQRKLNRSDNCWLCCYPFALLNRSCRGCIACRFDFKLFVPRIQNDLDFFEMYLFRADTSHGRVFKEIQIDKVLRKLRGEDHQVLHLFLDAQRDMNAQIRDKAIANERRKSQAQTSARQGSDQGGSTGASVSTSSAQGQAQLQGEGGDESTEPDLRRDADLTAFFKKGPGGFTRNPETFAYLQLQKHFGSVKWRPVEGIRDRLYGFVPYVPKHIQGPQMGQPKTNMALDISFGSSGYALVLARAFKKVISVNFHPFLRNEKEPAKKKAFYTNYVDVDLPVDIFTQVSTNINDATKKIFEHMRKPEKRPAEFIVIGPLTEESQIVTVTLTIEMLHTVELIEEKAILLAVRPLKIGHRIMTQRFYKYEPSVALFDGSIHTERVARDLKIALGDEADVMVDGFSGIRVYCGDTECIFEFVTYKYNGVKKKEETPEPIEEGVPNNDIAQATQHQTASIQRSQSMPSHEIAHILGQHLLEKINSEATQLARSMSVAVSSGPSQAATHSPTVMNSVPDNRTRAATQKNVQRQKRLMSVSSSAATMGMKRGSTGNSQDSGTETMRSPLSPRPNPLSEEEEEREKVYD